MSDSPNLGITYLEASQSQKHATVNEGFRRLDGLVQMNLLSVEESTPPGSPADGDLYWVKATGTGAWASQDGKIAAYQDGNWEFYDTQQGYVAFIVDEGRMAVYDTTLGWVSTLVLSPFGASIALKVLEEELTMSGASVNSTIQIPDRGIVLGVGSRTTEAITGATSYDVGDGTTVDLFGGTLNIALDSTNIGVIGPTAYYADTDLVVTANGSNFTGGKVRLSLYYLEFTAPTS